MNNPSAAKALLANTKSKKDFRNQKKRAQSKVEHLEFAQKNMESIKALLKERCPIDHVKLTDVVETYLKQTVSENAAELKLPPMNPGVLSLLLYNMALWLGNMNQANSCT